MDKSFVNVHCAAYFKKVSVGQTCQTIITAMKNAAWLSEDIFPTMAKVLFVQTLFDYTLKSLIT